MHPTGFPVYTILAGIFEHVFAVGTVAWRAGFFCAIAMSIAAWLVARCVRELGSDWWAACGASWLFAFGWVAWTRGTRAEVHALAVCFALAALFFALRYLREPRTATLFYGMLVFALGLATHPVVALLSPALLIVFTEQLKSFSLRALAAAVAALAIGLAFYAYLPLRSAQITAAHADPTRTVGLPPGRAFWDNDHPSSRGGFLREINGSEYGAGGALARITRMETYRKGIPGYLDTLLDEVSPVGLLLALGGLGVLWRRPDATSVVLLAAYAVPTAFSLAYTIEADPRRYQLIGFAVVCIFAGCGLSAFLKSMRAPRAAQIACSLALGVVFAVVNRGTLDQRSSYGAQAVIDAVLQKTPPDAILISPWIDATPLAYAAYVEHSLDGRIVDSAWLSEDARRVPKWTKTRPVYVVGPLFGEVSGFWTDRIHRDPDIYRLTRLPAQPASSRH